VKANDPPFPNSELCHFPSGTPLLPLRELWNAEPTFVHTTVSPTVMDEFGGTNLKSVMLTTAVAARAGVNEMNQIRSAAAARPNDFRKTPGDASRRDG
jgi:hypothetical protein